ncbi:uncharacterized protein LOC144411685 [Styela clava]
MKIAESLLLNSFDRVTFQSTLEDIKRYRLQIAEEILEMSDMIDVCSMCGTATPHGTWVCSHIYFLKLHYKLIFVSGVSRLGCDACDRWFHSECLKYSKKEARVKIKKSWRCPLCLLSSA